MCGIFLMISKNTNFKVHEWNDTLELLSHRGPDASEDKTFDLANDFVLYLKAWVLHLRGKSVESQPYVTDNQDVFLWNGELFGGLSVGEKNMINDPTLCDTRIIGDLLSKCKNESEILSTFGKIQGPWAFVFYQVKTGLIWFGRDYFGRRSLLISYNGSLVISSVGHASHKENWSEIPAVGIFCLDTKSLSGEDISSCIKCYPWMSVTVPGKIKIDVIEPLQESILSRCTMDREIFIASNVSCFTEETKVSLSPMVDAGLNSQPVRLLEQICDQNSLWDNAKSLLAHLKNAVKVRVQNVPHRKGCEGNASVGVLFSGGIDCTVLAAICSMYVAENEPIDLLNVAFENIKNKDFTVPDRITGHKSVDILRKLFPNRTWNFVEINVTVNELREKRIERVVHLVNPLVSVLDDSIGCAVWFAARGSGKLGNDNYQSTAKVLVCGMGADEQLAGYSRHRSAYEKNGLTELSLEIAMEVERISSRNLGRDDRIISDSRCEARFPFLDEKVVLFLNSLHVSSKADMRYGRGLGEKLILRAVAFFLGLEEVAVFPKRAIQFGSRIAKTENRKEKASDRCDRLSVK